MHDFANGAGNARGLKGTTEQMTCLNHGDTAMVKCFVAMGFGEKTAFYLGKKKTRTLDLDKTYENIIKPAVLAAGLECSRADEIQHSTMIDKPMYEHLLSADVVVADISTSNANAIYELGVRHALRPRTTIVMAEKDFAFPFDIARLNILRYEHLGKDIGASEAKRVSKELTERLNSVLTTLEIDSPVFLFLPQLQSERGVAQRQRTTMDLRNLAITGKVMNWLNLGGRSWERSELEVGMAVAPTAQPPGPSLAELRREFEKAKAAATTPQAWRDVVVRLESWRELEPDDPFVVQQLALATYKSEYPDKIAALAKASEILELLQPRVSSDAETVGLWGAVHKRLWDARQLRTDLEEAISSYQRGFVLKHDYYNGINLAFLLDVRANSSTGEEAIVDRLLAARARREVLAICDEELREADEHDAKHTPSELYWLRATRAEALFGLGRCEEAGREFQAAKETTPPPAGWMVESTEEQLKKLETLFS
jgi:tetratricopeptide (TPR) repeat protein